MNDSNIMQFKHEFVSSYGSRMPLINHYLSYFFINKNSTIIFNA